MTTHRWLDRPDQLPELAAALAVTPWLAIDTEANSMFVYRECMCLLQLNLGGEIWIVDTLALLRAESWAGLTPTSGPAPRSTALDPLRDGFARSDRTLWIHGGEYDCALLRRDFGLTLGGLWDTQQAGAFLNFEKTNYGALVERCCQIVLAKGHAQYDWATRPLDADALTYAIDDVLHLPKVGEQLRGEIATADLVEEHALANAAVAATASSSGEGGFDPAGFWRIKGVRDVPKDHLGVLAALYAWRDGVALILNKPPGRVVNNESLLAIARQAPLNFQHLKRTGVKGWILSEHGEALLATIKAARSQPEAYPQPPRHREVDEAEEKREDRLKDWRRGEALRRDVPLQVVLPAKALDHLKRHGAVDLATVPQLGAKRIALYGAKLTDLCR